MFVCLFVLLLYVPVNSYGPVKTVILPNHTFFLGRRVCFVALRPKSTAMVIAGWSVYLTTLFPGQLEQAVNQYFVHILSLVIDNNPS